MMEINRRRFICTAFAGIGALSLPGVAAAVMENRVLKGENLKSTSSLFLSACDDQAGQHWIGGWHPDGHSTFRFPVPYRAHAVTVNPLQQSAVFFARRPGTELYVVDLKNQELQQVVSSAHDRHFFGHGVFAADGQYLYTTENAYQQKHGVIGVYDTSDYRRIGEFHSGGIGPHQLALLSDGETLVIASGGILTHPDQPRKELNLDTMQSSLIYLDSRSGQVIDQFMPSLAQMSIRHLAVSDKDQVIIGVQFQGARSELLPLVLSHQGETQLQPMIANDSHWLSQNQYIASIAIDNSRQIAVTTSPRGNSISLWDMNSHTLIASHFLKDVAGAEFSSATNQFIVSNGGGEVFAINPDAPEQLHNYFINRSLRWDNHLAITS